MTLADLLEVATPGPWGTGHGAFGGADVHSEPDSMLVAKAWPGVGVLESDNARLIALAPDLARLALDMGEEIRQWAEPADDDCGDETCPDCAYTRRLNALLARLDGIANKDEAA